MFLFDENDKEKRKKTYISRHHFNRENKVILLMITDGEKWHHLAAKNIFLITRDYFENITMKNSLLKIHLSFMPTQSLYTKK